MAPVLSLSSSLLQPLPPKKRPHSSHPLTLKMRTVPYFFLYLCRRK